MTNQIIFKETQRFRQWWLWVLLLGINGLSFYGIYRQVISGEPFGDKPMSNAGLIATAGLLALITILFLNIRLHTIIRQDGIYVRFFPVHFNYKHYSWDSLNKSYVRQYSPIAEYGGWGLRMGLPGNGKAYNISGNKGLQLEFSNNKKLLIGTNKPDELKAKLQEIGQWKS